MHRFTLGDKVFITGTIMTRRRGQHGTVIGVRTSRYSRPGSTSLDKYTVRFDDGDQSEFYDIQLAKVLDPAEPRV
jgi:hypothetical protein